MPFWEASLRMAAIKARKDARDKETAARAEDLTITAARAEDLKEADVTETSRDAQVRAARAKETITETTISETVMTAS